MKQLAGRILDLLASVTRFHRNPYFGFIQGHFYLGENDLRKIEKLVGSSDETIVSEFERRFAGLVGPGEAISYAAARMGFFELMRILGIGKGDEVILQGATCSVMVNAVLRIGATPVFADIDANTYGSSSTAISACLTPHTRMIVAQHSFGIPCNIEPIIEIARERRIFLLEDCALTLGSTIKGITVGNFGDAALFSTDHSKPLNTLTGGLIYTKNSHLARSLRGAKVKIPDLPKDRQVALWNRFLFERKYCNPGRYGRLEFVERVARLVRNWSNKVGDFLIDDYGVEIKSRYPYPAALPAFLAEIGLAEINRWPKTSNDRRMLLLKLREVFSRHNLSECFLGAYEDRNVEIVPLRFVWFGENGPDLRRAIGKFLDVKWTWFLRPIVATNEPLVNFGYCYGSCPTAEKAGINVINLPCNFNSSETQKLLSLLDMTLCQKAV